MIKSSPQAKKLAAGALVLTPIFLLLLALLHILEPEFEPSWRMISEYELGDYGWLMRLAFFSLAGATLAVFAALRSYVHTGWGKVGLGLLLLAALGLILGGAFLTDPIITPQVDWSTSAAIHNLGGSLMILLSPFAAGLLSWSLAKYSPAWKGAGNTLLWPNLLMWLTTLVFFYIVISGSGAENPGPDVPMGYPNRAFILSYCYWLMVAAWWVGKSSGDKYPHI